MDLSGMPVTIAIVGVAALILLILILRFAHRPKKPETATGLGLGSPKSPPSPGAAASSSGGASGAVSGAAAAAAAARLSAADRAVSQRKQESFGLGSSSTAARMGFATSQSASSGAGATYVPDYAPEALGATVVSADKPGSQSSTDSRGCPKCGGRFLQGEMEGPTLMIDGVGREEFQPLLTACECASCGYLEFYTRPAPA